MTAAFPCAACNAVAGQPCRPYCTGQAAHNNEREDSTMKHADLLAGQPSLTVPTAAVRAEMKDYLAALGDSFALAQTWARIEMTDAEVAAECNISPATVWHQRRLLAAMFDGTLPPRTKYIAFSAMRVVRKWLREAQWSPEARAHLATVAAELEPLAGTYPAGGVAATEEAEAETAVAEAMGTPGVYVYALPRYLDGVGYEDSTLFKVGHSASCTMKRFRNQTNSTALPEQPILLRVYPTEAQESHKVERNFHNLLIAAGHYRRSSLPGGAGREWFNTSLRMLDAAARLQDLDIVVVNDSEGCEL
jgi:hypothetical protein